MLGLIYVQCFPPFSCCFRIDSIKCCLVSNLPNLILYDDLCHEAGAKLQGCPTSQHHNLYPIFFNFIKFFKSNFPFRQSHFQNIQGKNFKFGLEGTADQNNKIKRTVWTYLSKLMSKFMKIILIYQNIFQINNHQNQKINKISDNNLFYHYSIYFKRLLQYPLQHRT